MLSDPRWSRLRAARDSLVDAQIADLGVIHDLTVSLQSAGRRRRGTRTGIRGGYQ